ncbi:MAG TPA: UDP-glucose 4-epimerase GalE, partial [Bacteroidales bacterium]|nr:UDP-glucose 4-epimerase GalE [Bacteroidales bacterium]
MIKQKSILVTGGFGYIGSHTVVDLIKCGYKVFVVDDLSNSSPDVLDRIIKITGQSPQYEIFDLKQKDKVIDFFGKNSFDAVIHFAAFKAVGESVNYPLKYYRNNLNSLLNVLEGCLNTGVKNIVFSSSCTVYGQPKNEDLPVNEKTPIAPANSPYGNTKQISEEIITDFTISNPEFSAIFLRYFNPIGAHPSGLMGELPKGIPNNLIPFVTQTAIGLRSELKVFGGDYNTPDGTAIRDYIDIMDLVDAHIMAVKRLIENKNKANPEIFNLGTGKGTSVLEVINTFEKTTGKKINYKIVDRRSGDIEKV